MKIDAKSQRGMLWAGVIMSTVYTLAFVYLCEFWPLPSPTLDAAQVLELYTRHNLQTRFGAVLMSLTGAFYLPWAIVICAQMNRIEKGFPVWTVMCGLASTLGAWLFAIPAIIWGIAGFTVERDPQITLFAHQIGFLFFVAPACFFPMQLIPIAVVSLSPNNTDEHPAFPRWFGWFSLWTAVLASSGQMSMLFKTGPFAWNGLLSFYMPLVVFTVWVVVLVYTLLRAIGHQQRSASIE
jgi:hypothetical protein